VAQIGDSLWSAKLGEICGRSGDGPAPEWGFLDAWFDLTGAWAGCLQLVGQDGAEQHFRRGVPPGDVPAEPGICLIDRAEGGPLIRIHVADQRSQATLWSDEATPELVDAVTALLPVVRRALLRLARSRRSAADAAAQAAWRDTPMPMLLLDDRLRVVAANPAAEAGLPAVPGKPLPPWLERWTKETLPQEGRQSDQAWTVRADGATHNLTVLAIDASDPAPGRWLVSVSAEGPSRAERIELAESRFGLNARQVELLELMAEGLTRQQIADTIEQPLETIRDRVGALLDAVGASSRTELLARVNSLGARQAGGLVPPDAVTFRTGWCWRSDDGVVHVLQKPDSHIDVDDIEAFNKAVASFYEGDLLFIYSDASGVKTSTGAARKKSSEPNDFTAAVAVRGGTAVSRALVNLWLRVFPTPYPVRLFREQAAALQWLEEVRTRNATRR